MRWLLGLLLLLILSSCSQQTVVDALIPDRDKVQVFAFVEALRDNDMAKADAYIMDGPYGDILRASITSAPIPYRKGAQFRVFEHHRLFVQQGQLNRTTLMTEYRNLGRPQWVVTHLEYTYNIKYPQIIAIYKWSATSYTELPPQYKQEQEFNHMANKAMAVVFFIVLLMVGAAIFIIRQMRASR
jgi:hypothetical protein